MIIFNSIQYYVIDNNLDKNKFDSYNTFFSRLPLIYSFLSLGVLYLQYNK